MFKVLQRHVSTHMSHLQARTILIYKVTVLILGSQTLTCLFHGCYLLYYNRRLLQTSFYIQGERLAYYLSTFEQVICFNFCCIG